MKNILIVIFCLQISGCLSDSIPLEPDIIHYEGVLYIGDSICNYSTDGGKTAPRIVGIERDCRNGRRLDQYPATLPPGYRLYFIALGTNDIKRGRDPVEYGNHLKQLTLSTSASVYCVPPILTNADRDYDAAPYREQVFSKCENILDPLDWGVSNTGRVHWGDQAHINFAQGIYYVLDQTGIEPISQN